jgi:programmed cell death protein 5
MSRPEGYEGYGEKDQEKERRIEELKRSILRTYLTPEARRRLTNVSLVKPDIANSVENMIVSLVTSGKLKRMIDDEELKRVLIQVQRSEKKEFKIRRI